ncbi:hypothetical protein LB566_23425 [Mesorhizobium sp. CA13]|uniref:hypothetical protein n=1 Tax=Mesorhizobium sp. CA13 TaxID=2876643 RepID=UPI001CCF5741|nr:hypothetical protein [Mesorhizobium sp. CA13]MBZ9856747.1 hypothetical protein [Mesorhizobium sp. CA13]
MTGQNDGFGSGPEKKSAGKKKVSAVIGASIGRIEHALKRQTIRWPLKGMPYEGITPGAWRDEGELDTTGYLPADCPVRPLGYSGEDYYFIDTSGQVFNSGDKALGVERVQKLFAGCEDFLYWAWPSWSAGKNRRVTGFKAEEVRRDLYAACRTRGPWTPTDRVRGRGAWLDNEGRLILHCGEFLWVNGRLEDTGELGDYFYVRRQASLVPWAEPVTFDINPAVEIVKHLRTWNFERGDVDVMIALGWMVVSQMGAALEWRPSIFIVGDSGAGKSELSGKTGLFRTALGRSMLSTTNASEAGLYQIVGHDSLPIFIDELEGDDNPDQAQKIVKMARDAASGSVRIRGGSDHKGVEFAAQSTFGFSAINPPGIPPASMSRMAVLQLNPLTSAEGKAPRLKAPETVGPRLLRRVADHFDDFPDIYEAYRTTLREHGHNARGQNTFGTFLAAAHLVLGDEGMEACGLEFENLDHWGSLLAADAVPELENVKPTWLDCIEKILTRPIEQFKGGTRHTPAQVLEDLQNKQLSFVDAAERLASADLGLVDSGDLVEGYYLAVPHQSDILQRMLAGTAYAPIGVSTTSWSWALRRGPRDIFIIDKSKNRITIAGHQRRCTLVRAAELRRWLHKHG